MALPQRQTERYTFADYVTWPEDVRYELIHGEAYAMAPAPTRTRQLLVGELFNQVNRSVR